MALRGARKVTPLAWVVLAVSLAAVCAVHGPLIGYRTYANVDEAYAMGVAERLVEGFKLYDGAVSQRGPLMYYAFELIARTSGWDNVVAFRLWALGFALLNLALVWLVARRALSERAGVVATLLTGYAMAFGFPPADGAALHGETLQLAPLLLGAWIGAIAVRTASPSGRRWALLAASGALFGVAASVKQSAMLHPAALAIWLIADARRTGRATRAVGEIVVVGAATLVVPVAMAMHAMSEGTFDSFVYYTITYNREVHLRPTTQKFAWLTNVFFRLSEQTGFFFALAILASNATPRVLRRAAASARLRSPMGLLRGFGPTSYFALHALIAISSAASMWRFFPHYFLQAWPFVALWAGGLAHRFSVGAVSRRHLHRLVWAGCALLIACATVGTIFGERVDGRVAHDRTVQDLGKYIAASTAPDERIFVWGFSPWLYQYSHRRPAGRYMFETYVTGMVPWFWEKLSVERARIVPGSVELLLGDLEREKPAVVVDAGSIMLARPMRSYAPFSDWLHKGYCFEFRLGAFDTYRRKPRPDAQCSTDAFPHPHKPVDWSGRPLVLPLPRSADEAVTRRLPTGNYFKPIWFSDQPPPLHLDAMRDAKRAREEGEARDEGFAIEGEGTDE
jgi:hypothetical protein